eukprot:190137_1
MSLLNLILLVSLFSRNVVRSQDCPEGQFLCMEGGEDYCRETACDYSDDNDQGGDNDGPSDVNGPSGGYDDVNDDPSDVNDPSGGYDDDNDGPIGDNSGGNNDDDDFDGGESPCKEDEFQCLYEGNPVCTPNSWRCDQYQDCDDKEVEDQGCGGRFEHEEDVSTGAGSTSTMSVVTIVVLSVLAIAIVAFAVYCVCTRRTKTVYKKGLSNEDQMKDTNPMNMGEEFDEIEIETETMN